MSVVWHDFDERKITPEDFVAIIEIPKGSKKKYELDKNTGLIKLDRILSTSTHYPANYGFIPKTYADDDDPLDVLVLCSETLDTMVEVRCYPIGYIRMEDSNEIDDKIIAVPFSDPNFNYYKDVSELPPHITDEFQHFFSVYKELEHDKQTVLHDAKPREDAEIIIAKAIEDYQKLFPGR